MPGEHLGAGIRYPERAARVMTCGIVALTQGLRLHLRESLRSEAFLDEWV